MRCEVDLVWKAPRSIAKWGFLIHRYLSPATVTFILYGETWHVYFLHLEYNELFLGTSGIATGGRLSEKVSTRI